MNNFKLESIKASGRKHLENKYTLCIECTIIYFLLTFFLSIFQSFFVPEGITQILLFFLSIFAINFLITKLTFGLKGFYLNICCNHNPKLQDLFIYSNNQNQVTNKVITSLCLIKEVIAILTTILSSQVKEYSLMGCLTLLCIIALEIFLNTCFDILFMPLAYLAHDIKNKTASEHFLLAGWLMKGYKMKLFLLYLSFIPLIFLGIITCGIGLLWVHPYICSTEACFYLKIAKIKSADSPEQPKVIY